MGFCIEYGKFWSVLLELFIKHKPWNWEEWALWCCSFVAMYFCIDNKNYFQTVARGIGFLSLLVRKKCFEDPTFRVGFLTSKTKTPLPSLVWIRVIYDRVRNRKNYFEIAAFLNFEQETSREGNSNENKTQTNTSQLLRSVTLL